MRPMRILVLTPTFLPAVGGAELLLLNVFRRLAKQHEVMLLTPHLPDKTLADAANPEYDAQVNFEVRRYTDARSFMHVRGHRLCLGAIPPFSLSALGAVREVAPSFKPDVLNVHYCMPTGLAAWYAQKRLGIPTVLSLTGRDVPGPGVPPLWTLWHRFIGRACASRSYVTRFCREAIYGPSGDDGPVIFNGVNVPAPVEEGQADALRQRLGVPADARLLFALQRVDYLKRIDVIIKSLPKVLAQHPDTRLVVGGTGADLPRLKDLVRELGIDEHVVFAGFIPDAELPVYMAAADVFVFHSTYETFGMVLAEAMICALPCISVEDPAIAEVVDHGRTGLLVPIMDHEAFGKAINELLADPERMRAMGLAGQRKAQDQFLWDAVARQYEGLFESVVAGGTI